MVVGEQDPLLPQRARLEETRDSVPREDTTAAEDGFQDPRGWSATFKWTTIILLTFLAFSVSFTCIAIVPLADDIVLDLGKGSLGKSASVILVTIWELGEAAGPLFVAPLSEMFGRRVVLLSANALFILVAVFGALCQSAPVFILTRALGGLAVASNVLNPCIIADMFDPEERGTALSLVTVAPLAGTAIGPVVGGIVGERFGWRQIMWLCAGLAGICQAFLFVRFKETYNTSTRRAQTLNHDKSIADSLWVSVTRPAYIFCSSKVLMILCLFNAVTFAIYYILATTLADILENVYNQSAAVSGSCFLFTTAGLTIGIVTCKLTMDRHYKSLSKRNNDVGQPEFWLPWVIVGSIGIPASTVLYGWIPAMGLPLPVFLLSTVLLGAAMCVGFLPVIAYVVEATGIYSASAMAGVIVTRCLAGVFLPLLIVPSVRDFGYGWTFTIVGAVSVCVAPIPALIMWYGERWRQSSKYTRLD